MQRTYQLHDLLKSDRRAKITVGYSGRRRARVDPVGRSCLERAFCLWRTASHVSPRRFPGVGALVQPLLARGREDRDMAGAGFLGRGHDVDGVTEQDAL